MRKFFVILILLATILTLTACSNQSGSGEKKVYWRIDEDALPVRQLDFPRGAYINGELPKSRFDLARNIFGLNEIDFHGNLVGEMPFEVVKPNTTKLEATDKGKWYVAPKSYADFVAYEAGLQVDEITLYFVFITQDVQPMCHIKTLAKNDLTALINKPGPNQVLRMRVYLKNIGEFQPSLFDYSKFSLKSSGETKVD